MRVPRFRMTIRRSMLTVAIAALLLVVAVERARVHQWQCLVYASEYADGAAWYRSEARGNPATLKAADGLDRVRREFEAAAERPWQSMPPRRFYSAPARWPSAGSAPAR